MINYERNYFNINIKFTSQRTECHTASDHIAGIMHGKSSAAPEKSPFSQGLLINGSQLRKAGRAQAAFIEIADVLYLVDGKLHGAALAFGKRIGLALNTFAAALAGDNLVFWCSVHFNQNNYRL